MECPHLGNCVRPDLVSDLTDSFLCAECVSAEGNWLCLQCGTIRCGRYVRGHARVHSDTSQHRLCMSCDLYSVYCYTCDEYVSNDTPDQTIDKIRQHLMKARNYCINISECEESKSSEGASEDRNEGKDGSPVQDSLEDSSDIIRNSPARSFSSSPIVCLEKEDLELKKIKVIKSSEDIVRNLRPRKRTYSDDSNSAENLADSQSSQPREKRSNGRKEKKVVGLKNLGNTCFMNAVLQSLSNIQEFSCYFNSLPSLEVKSNGRRVYQSRSYTRQEVHDALMAEELRKVLINLSAGGGGAQGKGAISPECLFLVIWKVVPRFRGYQQQDAHEFLRYMLDRLHTELLQLLPQDVGSKDAVYYSVQRGRSSIVTSVFGGMLQSEVRCLACGTDSKKHDPFLDLSLDLPEAGRHDAPVELAECLSSFVQVEELADTERYFCSSCKSKQKSTKQFWIRRLPNVLCLHLKRFRWNNFFRTKVDTTITFPMLALDMSQFVLSDLPETRRSGSGGHLYDLAAVIVHHGSGAGSGHYTAFAINGEQWFHFNDQTVRPIDAETVVSCKPYILFYIRREFSLPHQPEAS